MTQAVIMAAGKSTRTYPLTKTRPKPLLKIANKTLLEHNMDALRPLVDEIILVVHYKKEMIIERFGGSYQGIKLTYVDQKEPKGTGHAILQVEKHIKSDMIILNGDDLYSYHDLKRALDNDNAILGVKVRDPSKFGALVIQDGYLKEIIEKPKHFVSEIVNIGGYYVDRSIFEILHRIPLSPRGEYEVTDAISIYAKKRELKVVVVEDYCIPIGYPWHILDATEFFLERMANGGLQGKIEDEVSLSGKIVLGVDSTVCSGARIIGPVIIGKGSHISPGAEIGPNTTIGNNCRIGKGSKIRNSVLFDDCRIGEDVDFCFSVCGFGSIVEDNVSIENCRQDSSSISTMIKDIMHDSGRKELGTIIGDFCCIKKGTHASCGIKVWPKISTCENEQIKKDKK